MIRIPRLRLYKSRGAIQPGISTLFVIVAYVVILVFTYHKYPYLLKIIILFYILPLAAFFYLRNESNRKTGLLLLKKADVEEAINTSGERISGQQDLRLALNKKINRYSYLKELTQELSLKHSLDEVTRLLLKAISDVFLDSESSCLFYLLDDEKQQLNLVGSRLADSSAIIKEKKGDIFDYWVLKKTQPLLIENTKADFRFDSDSLNTDRAKGIGSLANAPILAQSRPIGILRLDSAKSGKFSTEDLRLLSAISDLAAVAVENSLFYQHTKELAIKDGLTGLYLRRFFMERLREEFNRARLSNLSVSLLMLDIDDFKLYNDKFGHTAGDIVLKSIAKILTTLVGGAGNIISRFGGEEFIILLPDCSKKEAIEIANKIGREIKTKEIILRRIKTNVTVSIGVATFPDDSRIEEDLISKVDSLMYRAKQLGKDKVCSY